MKYKRKITLDDYMDAPSGVGPLANEWKDKPHRLVYDLVTKLRRIENVVQDQLTEVQEYEAGI